MNNKIKAFTLVELSIVLVIIGLLTAGVVGGQSLVQSAKRQKFITDINGYSNAVRAFQLEYSAFPGDLKDAASYWPTLAINGGGNGVVEMGVETFQVWKHLNLAGILPNTYTGTAGTGGVNYYDIGVNVPEIKDMSLHGNKVGLEISSTWTYIHTAVPSGVPIIAFSVYNTTYNKLEGYGISAKNSFNIDSKIDDGKYNSGKMIAYTGWATGCFSGGLYDVDATAYGCTIFLDIGLR